MGLFFFHFWNGDQLETDDVGIEFDSAEVAYLEAIAAARAIWPELLGDRRDPALCAFEISDKQGEVLFRIPFSELLNVHRSRTLGLELHRAILETNARAAAARGEVRETIEQVHRSLQDMCRLTSELSKYTRDPPPPSVDRGSE